MNHLVSLTLFLLVLNLAHCQHHPSFAQWKSSQGRNYADSSQELYRTFIYSKNVEQIKLHNSDTQRTYDQGVNKFTDLTAEQFSFTFLTLAVPSPDPSIQKDIVSDLNDDSDHPIVGAYTIVPIDWRSKLNSTILPKVKDQAYCGSCWSFAAASAMEFSVAVQFKLRANFSTQQFISCSNTSAGYFNNGCNGGWMPQAFRYAKTSNVSNDYQYPYVSASGSVPACDQSKRNKGFYNVSAYGTVASRYRTDTLCSPMLERLKTGPYSVAMDAALLQKYRSGIISASKRCGPGVNHAGVVIGNDVKGNWIVQNSWGIGWGERGYYRMAAGNTCGICTNGAMWANMNKGSAAA